MASPALSRCGSCCLLPNAGFEGWVCVWRGWGSIAGGCIGSQLLHDADETRDRLAQVGDLLLQVDLDGHDVEATGTAVAAGVEATGAEGASTMSGAVWSSSLTSCS